MKSFLVIATLLLFTAFTLLVLTKPISQDEGVFLTIGKYINGGSVLYRDFFDHKPPAIHLLFALLFKLFGTNLFVAKIALIVSALGTSVLVGKIGETLKNGIGWYAAGVFLFLMTQFEGYFLTAEAFLLLPVLLSLFLLLRKSNSGPWLFLAGASLSVAILFKQTAVLSAFPLLFLAYRATKHRGFIFTAGALLPILVLAAYLRSQGLVADAIHQVFTLTLTVYPREPLGSVLRLLWNNVLWTLPIWILLIVGLKARFPSRMTIWALVFLPLPFMFFRHYPHYWVQILPFVAIVAAIAVTAIRNERVVAAATLVFCILVTAGKTAQDTVPNYTQLKAQLRVARILSKEPVDALLAENQFTGFYFLLPQKPLNRYLYITEITNAEGAEERTIEDLQRGGSVLVLWPVDPNYAYAQKLQSFLLEHATQKQVNVTLGMRVLLYEPVTSQ
jgi:hypothetical protein